MVLLRPAAATTSLTPWQEITDMQNRIRQLFGAPFTLPMMGETMGWNPAVDISEANGELLVTAELPGLQREDVHIDLADDVLTIRGEKKEEKTQEDKNLHVLERSYGSFRRSFTLPMTVDESRVDAQFKDGVLKIRLPISERARGREIEIKIG